VAIRYDSRDNMFRGSIDVASIRIWLRDPRPMPVRQSEVADQLNGIGEGEFGLFGPQHPHRRHLTGALTFCAHGRRSARLDLDRCGARRRASP
jgi:hypothetical protein